MRFVRTFWLPWLLGLGLAALPVLHDAGPAAAPIPAPIPPDATALLQSKLNAAALPGANRLVLLDEGTFRTTAQLVWPDVAGLRLAGKGAGITRIVVDHGGLGIFAKSAAGYSGLAIADLTIQGGPTLPTTLVHVEDLVGGIKVQGVAFRRAGWCGFRVTTATPGLRLLLEDCLFSEICSVGMPAIPGGAAMGSLPYTTFRRCRFVNTGNNDLHHALYPYGKPGLLIEDCTFEGLNARLHLFSTTTNTDTVVRRCTWDHVQRVVLVDCPGCTFVGNTLLSCRATIGANAVRLAGNSFATDQPGILIEGLAGAADVDLAGNDLVCAAPLGATPSTAIAANGPRWRSIGNTIKGFQTPFLGGAGDGHRIETCSIETPAASGREVIWLQRGLGHTIAGCTLRTNSARAVWLDPGATGTLDANQTMPIP